MSQPDDLTPDEQDVRRLLADARHNEPLPDDVAARLDGVLAALHQEDPADPVPTTVPVTRRPADLEAARRRRNARGWLLAAAAVVVVGVGINQVGQGDLSGGDADSGGSADSIVAEDDRANRPEATTGSAAAGAGSPSDGTDAEPSPETSAETSAARLRPVRLDSARFGDQVRRLQAGSELERQTGDLAYSLLNGAWDADAPGAYAATCPTDRWGRGVLVPVRYDGDAGALVFRRVRGDTQVVDLFLCGADEPARSITLPAP